MDSRTLVMVSAGALLGATMLAGLTAAARAQAPDPNESSVTLDVTPQEIPVNGQVTVSGLGYPEPGATITVTVTPPAGSATTLTTAPDVNGHYAVTFTRTPAEGLYKVAAQIGAKGSAARGTFSAKTYALAIDDDVADSKALLEETMQFVKSVKHGVDHVPDSPAKTEMEGRLNALDAASARLPQQSPQLAAALEHFTKVVAKRPDARAALQPLFDHLAQLDADTKKSKAAMARQIQGNEKNLQTCDAIDHATRALNAVPEMIAILEKPYQFAVSFATHMVSSEPLAEAGARITVAGELTTGLLKAVGSPGEPPADSEIEIGSESEIADHLVERIPESVRSTPGYTFAVSETKKFLPSVVGGTKGPRDLFDTATRVAGDVLAYANDRLFSTYCQKFEGQFTATMLAHFFSRPNGDGHSAEWWTYSTALSGTLVLRYPRDAAGTSIALSGQLEGGATRFTYSEDVFDSGLFGDVANGGSVHLKDVAPAAADNTSPGMLSALTSPTSFYIPVTGHLSDGKITLTLGDAHADFNDNYTRGHTLYVVIAPATLMRPVLGHFSLPYTNARFVLNQVVNGDYVIRQGGTSMWVERDTTRDRPSSQNDAVYTLHLRACNPACGS
jgi:hypothetical protein